MDPLPVGEGVGVGVCWAPNERLPKSKQITIKRRDAQYVLNIRVDSFNLAFEFDGAERFKSVWNANTGSNSKEMIKTARPPEVLLKAAILFILMFAFTESHKAQGKLESIYSDLSESKCRTIEVDKETGGSTQRCPGIAGYRLMVLDDDARQSVTVVTPDGKNHPLDFWQVITGAFSSVGNKAEWRVTRSKGKVSPVALIVRVNASEDIEHPNRLTSYLAVVKVTPEKICVTHRITPGAKANENARRAADTSQTAGCLEEVAP